MPKRVRHVSVLRSNPASRFCELSIITHIYCRFIISNHVLPIAKYSSKPSWYIPQSQLNLPIDDGFTLKQSGSGTVAVTGYRSSLPKGAELADGQAAEAEVDVWGVVVPPGKKGVTVELKDSSDESVRITQLALGPKAKNSSTCVQLTVGKLKSYIGTLHPDDNPQFEVRRSPGPGAFPHASIKSPRHRSVI